MANIKRFRETPDLVTKLADMERRLALLENTRRIGTTSIDSGRLVVNQGDIVFVDSDGHATMTLQHGDTPVIRMLPGTQPGYHAALFAWDSGDFGAIYEQHIEQQDGTRDGGKLLLQKNAAYLSHQPASGAEAFIAVGDLGLGTEHFRLRGRWPYNTGYDEQDAIICGFDSFGAGFGASSYSFPFTFDQVPIVICNIMNAGTAVAWDLSAVSTSGFSVAWATGTTAKTVMWVAFRR
jgi:hypothetical protein